MTIREDQEGDQLTPVMVEPATAMAENLLDLDIGTSSKHSGHHSLEEQAMMENSVVLHVQDTLPSRPLELEDPETDAVRQWKSSPFAVGLVRPTWQEEMAKEHNDNFKNLLYLRISGFVCGSCLRRERLGHMTILWKTTPRTTTTTNNDGNNNNNTDTTTTPRPRILLMAGPFWFWTVFITIPVISALSCVIFVRYIVDCYPLWISILWGVCLGTCLFSLLRASTMDPGIQYRYSEPPQNGWIWNDQAKTYRSPTAKYVSSCAVVVEGYDHVCPWVGTAIGANNMAWFRRFVWMVGICLILDVILIMLYAHGGLSIMSVGCSGL